MLATRSIDGGQSFAELQPITSNNESQRFAALGLDADGSVFAAWIDKRNRVPAQQEGRKYEGAGLFFASSKDGGAAYAEARIASDNTCECCRLGLAFAGPGRPVVVFRNIFEGGVRDHAVMTFTDPATPGEVRRVSNDDWQISACPHHGPSLSISAAGTYHVAWYTNGKARKGLFYARSQDEGRTFSDPLPLGRADRNPTRPYVLAGPRGATMVWKEFDGERTSVNAMTSHDEGKSWSKPVSDRHDDGHVRPPAAGQRRTGDLPFLDDQGRRISPAADRRRIMKRLLAAIFLFASLAAAPAAETPSELKPFVRGSWQEMLRSPRRASDAGAFLGRHLRPVQGRIAAARTVHEGPFRDRRRNDQRRSRSEPAAVPRARCWRRPGWGRRRTGFSPTVLSNASDSRSTRPGRARSRARC